MLKILVKAIRELEAKSDVRFYRRQDKDEDYITTYRGGGCSSSVGRQGGQQSISLADGCDSRVPKFSGYWLQPISKDSQQ